MPTSEAEEAGVRPCGSISPVLGSAERRAQSRGAVPSHRANTGHVTRRALPKSPGKRLRQHLSHMGPAEQMPGLLWQEFIFS